MFPKFIFGIALIAVVAVRSAFYYFSGKAGTPDHQLPTDLQPFKLLKDGSSGGEYQLFIGGDGSSFTEDGSYFICDEDNLYLAFALHRTYHMNRTKLRNCKVKDANVGITLEPSKADRQKFHLKLISRDPTQFNRYVKEISDDGVITTTSLENEAQLFIREFSDPTDITLLGSFKFDLINKAVNTMVKPSNFSRTWDNPNSDSWIFWNKYIFPESDLEMILSFGSFGCAVRKFKGSGEENRSDQKFLVRKDQDCKRSILENETHCFTHYLVMNNGQFGITTTKEDVAIVEIINVKPVPVPVLNFLTDQTNYQV